MPKTDRPYQSVEIVPFAAENRRLRPPDGLSDRARTVFTELVVTHSVGHFRPGDLTLLTRYCELAGIAERCEFEMSQPHGLVAPDGKVAPWHALHASTVKSMNGLALRLRLGPQSRALKQSKKTIGTVGYYDRMAVEARE